MLDHIYLSPHLDDAIFSCGGVIYQQTSQGEEVALVTICAGDSEALHLSPFAQSLHRRWGFDGPSAEARREEDLKACERVGAQAIHLQIPEAIYRLGRDGSPLYTSEEAIFGDLHPSEDQLPDLVAGMLDGKLQEMKVKAASVYVPSGYGGHVDHVLLREAVGRLDINALFYRDFPYAMRGDDVPKDYPLRVEEVRRIRLSEEEIQIWAEAIMEYKSQLSTFWEEVHTIEGELKNAHVQMGGIPFLASSKPSNKF